MTLARSLSFLSPLDEDQSELLDLAARMEATVPPLAQALVDWRDRLEAGLKDADTPLEAERVLEDATRSLRHIWLRAAASSTAKIYRSPADDQTAVTAKGRFQVFGYERDLQPYALETRCRRFFQNASGTAEDHVLFSSGQAAMLSVLTLLASRQERTLKLRHDGSYFETTDLLSLFAGRFKSSTREDVDVVIAEPLFCDGQTFGATNLRALGVSLARETRSLIIDSTLAGMEDGLPSLLSHLPGDVEVFRLHSGLKLFQAGLELADVGIVSVYGSPSGDALRRIRTLLGSGLRFADVAALELSTFLDPVATGLYEDAIFRHNAMLADAARANPAFDVAYPSGGRAPFVVLNLRSADGYDRLDKRIEEEAARCGVLFQKGGSFGFRSHRFETVRPEGRQPFLRVAMGRRGGASLDGITELFRTLRL